MPRAPQIAFPAFAIALCLLTPAFAAEDFSTSAGTVRITPIQHASFMIEAGGQVIYVDPAMGSYEGRPPADLVLITDIHGDHMAPAVLAKVRKPSTVIFAPEAVAKTVTDAKVIRNGESRSFGKWTVEALPMYNLTRGPAPAATATSSPTAAPASTYRGIPKESRRCARSRTSTWRSCA